MHESDIYRENILVLGEARLGPPEEAVRTQLANIKDLERLKRMICRAVTATNWQEILDTP